MQSNKVVLICVVVLVIASCQTNSARKRELFVYDFNRNLGSMRNTNEVIEKYQTGYYDHIKLVNVITKSDGATHVVIDWWKEGCRVAEVYRDNVFVDWYFVANEDKCYALTDWGGPW